MKKIILYLSLFHVIFTKTSTYKLCIKLRQVLSQTCLKWQNHRHDETLYKYFRAQKTCDQDQLRRLSFPSSMEGYYKVWYKPNSFREVIFENVTHKVSTHSKKFCFLRCSNPASTWHQNNIWPMEMWHHGVQMISYGQQCNVMALH